MTIAIAFLCKNAVEPIQVQNHRKKFNRKLDERKVKRRNRLR